MAMDGERHPCTGSRSRTALLLLLLAFGSATPAAAEEAPKDEAALVDEFRALVERDGEEQTWDWLQRTELDPWIVAERLVLGGHVDLARRLPASGLTGDRESLAAYLESPVPPAREQMDALDAASALLEADKPEDALARLGEIPGALTVSAVRALVLRGEILGRLGKDKDAGAIEALERAAERASVLGWRAAEIDARTAVLARIPEGEQQQRRRRILTALVALDSDTRDLARSATWCGRLGRLEVELGGSMRLARGWLLEADGLFEALATGRRLSGEQMVERARTVVWLALAHLSLNYKARALATARRGHRLSQNVEDIPARDRVLASKRLADARWALSMDEKAEEALLEAVKIAEEANLPEQIALRGDLALLWSVLGHYEKAERQYERVRSSEWVKSNPSVAYIVRLHIASLHLERPPKERVKAKVQEALIDLLALLRELEAAPADLKRRAETEANAQALTGRAHLLLNRYHEAEMYLRRAAESPYTKSVPLLLPYVRTHLAKALRYQGKTKEALEVLRSALADLEAEIRALPGSFALNVLTQWQSRALVDECRTAAAAIGTTAVLRWALEGTRGLAFRVEVNRRRLRQGGSHAVALVPESAALRADVARAARAYWTARASGARQPVVQARKELWERRKRLRAAEEQAGLEAAIAAQAAEKAEPGGPRFKDRKALRPDEALLYLIAPDERQLLIVKRHDRYKLLDVGAKSDVEALVERAAERWVVPDEGDALSGARKITAIVFPPALRKVLADPSPVRHVYVSASGPLARLPWPFLFETGFEGAAGGVPTSSMIASEAVLGHVRTWNPPARGGPILALGDPDYTASAKHPLPMVFFGHKLRRLTHSATEVRAIVDEERDDVGLLAADANEQQLRRHLFEAPYPFDVLHFACHGLLYQKVPWLSALAIHAAAGEDGLVTVDEIARWEFPRGPRLVVLSACKTGLGAPVPGEGEDGLVRAFQLAGARHVVASLWNVPDRGSSHLMIAFHKKLREGMTPAQALRAAQAETKAAYPHPHAWAGWNVWGPGD